MRTYRGARDRVSAAARARLHGAVRRDLLRRRARRRRSRRHAPRRRDRHRRDRARARLSPRRDRSDRGAAPPRALRRAGSPPGTPARWRTSRRPSTSAARAICATLLGDGAHRSSSSRSPTIAPIRSRRRRCCAAGSPATRAARTITSSCATSSSRSRDRIARELGRPVATRPCVDSAPVLEREWAERGGLGFVAKNTMLIAPGLGSYVVLGELLLDVELAGDRARVTAEAALRQLPRVPRRVPDRRVRRRLRARRAPLHLVPDDRASRRDPARAARVDRHVGVRLRRLPGGLPVQRGRRRAARAAADAAQRRARAARSRRARSDGRATSCASSSSAPRCAACRATCCCATSRSRSATRGSPTRSPRSSGCSRTRVARPQSRGVGARADRSRGARAALAAHARCDDPDVLAELDAQRAENAGDAT